MIKKIRVELTIFVFLIINIFLSYRIDVGVYNFFSKINYGFGSTYLKSFFISITELGDSLWYFLFIICFFILIFVLQKLKAISYEKYLISKNFCFFSFFYLLLVGLITQIIKHIVGRPRPNHTDFNEVFSFQFFSTDSAFHSFPSGHSSTIIAVVIILGLLIPALRIFFYFCGFLIAVSRVVVGAHFFSDVLAGALLAVILYKILIVLVDARFPKTSFKNLKINNDFLLGKTMIVFFVVSVFITIGFDLDIFLSSLFYYGNNQFLLQSYDLISIIFRKIFLPFLIFYIFILPIITKFFSFNILYFGYRFMLKEIIFVWTAGFTTLVLIVNFFFKNNWGRTRPNEILEFGGQDFFTPWYVFGQSCVSNCSFVSGDSSVGFVLIIFYFITKKNAFIYLSLFSGAILGFVRIIAGGHFLSDIIFSQIIVTASIFVFFIFFKRFFHE